MDGDGCITVTTCPTLNFTGTDTLLMEFARKFNKLGINLKSGNEYPPFQYKWKNKIGQISYSGKMLNSYWIGYIVIAMMKLDLLENMKNICHYSYSHSSTISFKYKLRHSPPPSNNPLFLALETSVSYLDEILLQQLPFGGFLILTFIND